jgi:hypothetical protein
MLPFTAFSDCGNDLFRGNAGGDTVNVEGRKMHWFRSDHEKSTVFSLQENFTVTLGSGQQGR